MLHGDNVWLSQKQHIILVGNPGTGKSTLLNSLLNKIEFQAGWSTRGVTKHCKSFRHTDDKVYSDTPGLANVDIIPAAADEIHRLFLTAKNVTLVFVVTLDDNNCQVKPSDVASVFAILDACQGTEVNHRFGIVINRMISETRLNRFPPEHKLKLAACLQGKFKTRHVYYNLFDKDFEDEENMLSSVDNLAFRQFVFSIPPITLNKVVPIFTATFVNDVHRLEAELAVIMSSDVVPPELGPAAAGTVHTTQLSNAIDDGAGTGCDDETDAEEQKRHAEFKDGYERTHGACGRVSGSDLPASSGDESGCQWQGGEHDRWVRFVEVMAGGHLSGDVDGQDRELDETRKREEVWDLLWQKQRDTALRVFEEMMRHAHESERVREEGWRMQQERWRTFDLEREKAFAKELETVRLHGAKHEAERESAEHIRKKQEMGLKDAVDTQLKENEKKMFSEKQMGGNKKDAEREPRPLPPPPPPASVLPPDSQTAACPVIRGAPQPLRMMSHVNNAILGDDSVPRAPPPPPPRPVFPPDRLNPVLPVTGVPQLQPVIATPSLPYSPPLSPETGPSAPPVRQAPPPPPSHVGRTPPLQVPPPPPICDSAGLVAGEGTRQTTDKRVRL